MFLLEAVKIPNSGHLDSILAGQCPYSGRQARIRALDGQNWVQVCTVYILYSSSLYFK